MERLIDICGLPTRIRGHLLRIARPDADTYRALDDPESTIDKLRNCKPRVDLFTFMQPLALAMAMVLTLGTFPGFMEWDDWAVMPVSTFDQWWTEQADENVRNKVRKAEKSGVVVRQVSFDGDLARGIWEIYNDLPVRHGRPYPHYGKDMETVYSELATFADCSIFLGAFLEDELIGFMKLTVDETATQLKTMSLATMARHRDKAVMNALVAQAVKMSAERGIPNLIYGSFTYGKRGMDGLSHFKRDNGFLRINLPRYYIPLTSISRAAFRLGLHHQLAYHLPEPVFAKLRGLRNAYYNHRLRAWSANSHELDSQPMKSGSTLL